MLDKLAEKTWIKFAIGAGALVALGIAAFQAMGPLSKYATILNEPKKLRADAPSDIAAYNSALVLVVIFSIIGIVLAVFAILLFTKQTKGKRVPTISSTEKESSLPSENAVYSENQQRKPSKFFLVMPSIGGALIVLLLAVTAFTTANSLDTGGGASLAAKNVQAEFVINESGSDTVYQQMVSAQWATKDLLQVIADQNVNLVDINQNLAATQAALMWAMVGLGVLIATLISLIAGIGLRFLKNQ